MPYDRTDRWPRRASRGTGTPRDGTAPDRGQVALEYLGFVPVLLLVALAGIQLGLIAYTAQQAGTAARAGARSASLQQSAQRGCTQAVSGWLADGTRCTGTDLGDAVRVTADVDIPSLVPGWDFGQAHRTATMPLDRASEAGPGGPQG
ncbi:TadE/TadG family type IV pilus assembly protein [Streptomyces sp. MS06]|uniref:TadE/TadG family type IV pilus assembly protein n=1 Tax=Streptomyces sp. MS06 TaxID=3385974 RepID=UPI0039A2A49E